QNPGGFDYEAYLLEQRIRATGYVREKESYRRLSGLEAGDQANVRYRLNRFRQKLSSRIQELLPEQPFAGMITAFANGDDKSVPDAQWEVLSRTGTIHLVAISGMNIGLIAGIVYVLVRVFWSLPAFTVLAVPAPRIAAIAAFGAAAGYAALAGFAIPTQRALAMLAVILAGLLLGRRTTPGTLLALALLVVLLVDPLSVMAAGFWLSFLAVAVILYSVDGSIATGWKKRLWQWGRVQWAITIGLLPLLILLFQQASIIAPVANLAAIPVIETVTIPATLLGAAMSFIVPDSIAVWPLRLAEASLEWLWPLLSVLARTPGALWAQHAPVMWTLIPAVVGIALLLAPRGFPGRWLGVFWLLPFFLVRPESPKSGEVWFTLLDVGQGLAAVVRTQDHVLVYDTGARFSSRFDAGRSVVIPFLRHAGLQRVDTLVVSHGDNDHIGGSSSVLAALPVARILTSVPDRFVTAEFCQSGLRWIWNEVSFEILHPGSMEPSSGKPLKGNNRSCVLSVSGRHGRVLLPGDIATRAERILVAGDSGRLRADILVAPHHGSKSSSSENFLEAVQPRLILFPVGYRNRHHHPHPDVVARYLQRGIRSLDSPASGAISAKLDGDGVSIERYRESHHRYWRTE
ncbi:MAG: DNA internalization-related competence protein ComEC/Rec2, partial [Gammaproteobacteria bacterium]|nr:DNA internalization-related competence protein ComEC/Rec2 [Gammaproteobacteria bacterium]